jgi:hypothetical protein
MRSVRNIVNTGRTIVCTIHQPSIDIFESFDELLLLKRGGQTIYAGHIIHSLLAQACLSSLHHYGFDPTSLLYSSSCMESHLHLAWVGLYVAPHKLVAV